ncbi:reverse transcriptase [Gossypium australe]|uniref:Reverse transcriptase n=1 Tax=Gossypium australe TaxID=47621 RepID=A0A5B6VMT5_9ROSI|nr:reverse transcriptase [Gossypium australe]
MDFVAKCLTYQHVKAEHQFPSRLLHPIKIPYLKWELVTMDFVSGLPLTPTKKDSIWVIVDRLTMSTHFLSKKLHKALGAKLDTTFHSQTDRQSERETEGKVRLIQDRPKVASNRQKLYADQKRKDVEFSIGDRVYSERITMKESYEVWTEGQVEAKVHWALQNS